MESKNAFAWRQQLSELSCAARPKAGGQAEGWRPGSMSQALALGGRHATLYRGGWPLEGQRCSTPCWPFSDIDRIAVRLG